MSRKMNALDVTTSMQVVVKVVVTTIKPTVTQPQRRQCVSAAQDNYVSKALGMIMPMQEKLDLITMREIVVFRILDMP